MNNRIKIPILIAVALLTVTYLVSIVVAKSAQEEGAISIAESVYCQTKLADTKHDIDSLSRMHLQLEESVVSPTIDTNKAVENAKKAFDWVEEASQVEVEYYTITNTSFQRSDPETLDKNSDLQKQKPINKTPAYIVSFEGVTEERSVPVNYTGTMKAHPHHELNVIVDAKTGEALMAFTYR